MLKITKIIIFLVAFVSPSIYADLNLSANDVDNSRPAGSEQNTLPVRPVEVGTGDNIKLERKSLTRAEIQFEWHGHILWESRYVTEGRDNLSGKGLVSLSTEFTLAELSILPWVAKNSSADYNEFNLNIVYGTSLAEELTLYGGYNYIRADDSGEMASDNEISLDLAYNLRKHVNFQGSIYHSFDADGSFMEFSLNYNRELSNRFNSGLQGLIGFNAGYVVLGHNGLNHLQLRARASYLPLPEMELSAYAVYSEAIDRDTLNYSDDELLKDFFLGRRGPDLSFLV